MIAKYRNWKPQDFPHMTMRYFVTTKINRRFASVYQPRCPLWLRRENVKTGFWNKAKARTEGANDATRLSRRRL